MLWSDLLDAEDILSLPLMSLKNRVTPPPGTKTTLLWQSQSRACIQGDIMTVNSLMLRWTWSSSNRWRCRCLLQLVLHYELWLMNHRGSALLQFSLGLVTTKFIDTKSGSREPGGYKCKTAAIWDIYNLCALDVLICKKKKKKKTSEEF